MGAAPAAAGAGGQAAGAVGQAAGGAGQSAGLAEAGQGVTGTNVQHQVHDMLGQIDSSLQLNHTLKLLIAALILQAFAGGNDNDGPLDSAAAFVGASAAATALTGLSALSHQANASASGAQAFTNAPASVQQTPYAGSASDLPTQQTVNLRA
jgi:hypothetical protein